MSELIDLKAELVKAWRELKNEKLPKELRSMAYADIVKFSEEVLKLDSNFKMNIVMLGKYKEFKSVETVPRVVWPECDKDFGVDLEEHLEKLTAVAVRITKKRLPREPQDSQLFGMIISATVDKLIALAKN